ncbi:MAG: decaprenyl-phosphate phosphoribosyltransferase [Actinomycetota bacterium]|nr:decaprenyl-phosphate phosphoribosyltransferase [Actinomycetota bacterium]
MRSAVLVRAARPRHWLKNVLVVAAPVAAGVALQPRVLVPTLLAFVAFCLAASGIYLVNDVLDIELDRHHPNKRLRPVASGSLSVPTAATVGSVVLLAALALSVLVSVPLFLVLLVYELIQLGYCFGLKHEPVIELGLVSSGFVLRAVAGGVANDLPLSNWFLMAGGFGSLFMVAGKRYAEVLLAERTGLLIRRVLSRYTSTFLRFVWTVGAGALIMTYALWAFERRDTDNNIWTLVSLVPLVFGVLRYALDIDSGSTDAPERIVVTDRVLLVTAVLWAASFLVSVYA